MKHLAGLVLILGLVGCGKLGPLEDIPTGTIAEWSSYGATPGGTHFSSGTQITPDNVGHLKQAWVHRSGDFRDLTDAGIKFPTQSAFEVTPIVVEDRLYYCSPFNNVYALNAETGEEIWAYKSDVDRMADVMPICRGVNSWQSGKTGFCEHRIITGTLDARLIALDAETGKPCEGFGDKGEVDVSDGLSEHNPWEYSITSPPAILGDRIITGAHVFDNQRTGVPSGVVRSYDVRTGELLWAWNPVKPGTVERNDDDTYLAGTTNVWSIISVDAGRDMVFVPTGNTSPDYYGGHRGDLDYYSSSVVALAGETGEVIWRQQLVHHDIWDYDTPAQPTLIDITVDGSVVPALVQVTKMGMTFAFNRDTGEPLWPIEERPVPQEGAVPEESISPTQPFPTHIPYQHELALTPDDAWGMTPWDRGKCEDLIAEKAPRIYTPPSLTGTVSHPSAGGGSNWGSPAIDPRTGIMVVYTMRVPTLTTLVPRAECEGAGQPQTGTPYCVETTFLASPLGVPCTAPPWGTLDAIDITAGEYLWSVPMGTTRDIAPFPVWWIKGLPGFAAPMMTASGLVFSGVSNEHAFRAYDVKTGEELWKADLPTSANALPMSYQISESGRQYVVVAAGGHWSGGSPAGDYLIAYSLP